MKDIIKRGWMHQWRKRRIARFKTSGCALCWHYCSHEKRFLP
jgi:hypothetical protein